VSAVAETVESSRFGSVEIAPESIVEFPDGLIGLGGSRFALISTGSASPFLWLQSLENPALALPVTNPHRFFSEFTVELNEGEAERIGLDDGTPADVYVTVTASPELAEFTANLKAPILIRDGRAHQVINQAEGATVRVQLFPDGEHGAGRSGGEAQQGAGAQPG
jgi:flagellar assembly factor FliW